MPLITFPILIFILLSLKALTIQSSNYFCQENNISIQFTLSTSNHSASNPTLNCSLQQCNGTSLDNQTCSLSPTPCFNYQTVNNSLSYCAPAIQCSILELCDNVTYSCASNNSICIVNSCCSPSAVCLPLSVTNYCKRGKDEKLIYISINSEIFLIERNETIEKA
ncbi:hypothetical protein I4U23_011398 [Adineta vaga]|nr:hypothetical protein I4U23_011398 [Adineta vaga]